MTQFKLDQKIFFIYPLTLSDNFFTTLLSYLINRSMVLTLDRACERSPHQKGSHAGGLQPDPLVSPKQQQKQ